MACRRAPALLGGLGHLFTNALYVEDLVREAAERKPMLSWIGRPLLNADTLTKWAEGEGFHDLV